MGSPTVNTRSDLDAIAGTLEHVIFMNMLAKSLWRVERDSVTGAWRAVEDNSVIARFGFTRADFPDASPPVLPDHKPVAAPVPKAVTMRQARLALLNAGLLTKVSDAIASMPGVEGDAARIEWEFSSTVERHRPLVLSLAPLLGFTDAQIDDLFRQAATL